MKEHVLRLALEKRGLEQAEIEHLLDTYQVNPSCLNLFQLPGEFTLMDGQLILRSVLEPTVVCLCGSTRFSEAFREANLQETLAGKIVLSIGCDFKSDSALGFTESDKARMDRLHLRKIDLADEVLILNVGGYVGISTAREILYSIRKYKTLRFLEPLHATLPNRYACLPGETCTCEFGPCQEIATWWHHDGGWGTFYCEKHVASVLLTNKEEVAVWR